MSELACISLPRTTKGNLGEVTVRPAPKYGCDAVRDLDLSLDEAPSELDILIHHIVAHEHGLHLHAAYMKGCGGLPTWVF